MVILLAEGKNFRVNGVSRCTDPCVRLHEKSYPIELGVKGPMGMAGVSLFVNHGPCNSNLIRNDAKHQSPITTVTLLDATTFDFRHQSTNKRDEPIESRPEIQG